MTRPTNVNIDLTMLNPQQWAALDLTGNGTSFFVAGDPGECYTWFSCCTQYFLGMGKTFTIIKIIEYLLTKYSKHEVAVTASIGAAANKIQGKFGLFFLRSIPNLTAGQTIHSWAGLTGCETITKQALIYI